jgi:hypothetical protein
VSRALLDHWTAIELATVDHARGTGRAKSDALDLLIAWQWALAEAHDTHVAVTSAQAGKQLDLSLTTIREGTGTEWFAGERKLRPLIANLGVSLRDRLLLMRMAMLKVRIGEQQAKDLAPSIPAKAVLDYYRRHRAKFEVGERRDIKAVMNYSKAKVLEAKHQMQYEKDFFSAPPHVLIGPRKEILYYVFEVFHVRRGYERSLYEVEASIRNRLATLQLERGASARVMSWRSRTSCHSGYRAGLCGRYV